MDLKDAAVSARGLMDEYGLEDWHFEFDRAVTRLGCCRHDKKLITLSRKLTEMNSEKECIDTILHEIAHALAGPKAHHGPLWKAHARRLGCRPRACAESSVSVKGDVIGKCPGCDKVFRRHRKPSITSRYYCTGCYRRHGEKHYIKWSRERAAA
jgi:predicted SprT family Zn-dependent metalloprotease